MTKYDDEYVHLLCTQVDGLCPWVMEVREEVAKNGDKVLVDLVAKSCREMQQLRYE